jgi:hypothetical protein
MILNRRFGCSLAAGAPQKNLRGLAGTLIPQASRTSAMILGRDTDLLFEYGAKPYTLLVRKLGFAKPLTKAKT